MKAIILFSSIFYILGLKISNKIDLVKHTNPVEKIVVHTTQAQKSQPAIAFEDAKTQKNDTEINKPKSECIDVE